jgi:hypothetical protein
MLRKGIGVPEELGGFYESGILSMSFEGIFQSEESFP